MAHCTKCGAVVPNDAAFCGSCGAPQASPGSSPFPPPVPGAAMTQPQMSENVAATLSYALGWVTGLIFYFIDKRPWNWLEVGLIHLILPQARIIDIRREPMAACFAMFKQVLPIDAAFSYDLDSLGIYYNKYVSMMEHWQSALPGR